jgi:hypothetical protein
MCNVDSEGRKQDCKSCCCPQSKSYGKHRKGEADVVVRIGMFARKTYKCRGCGIYM